MKTYFRKILEGLACIENIQEAVFYTLYFTALIPVVIPEIKQVGGGGHFPHGPSGNSIEFCLPVDQKLGHIQLLFDYIGFYI